MARTSAAGSSAGAATLVRPLIPNSEDRDRVRMICCETGIAGRPIEHAWHGRGLFADFWSLYYTDYEPQSCFIADADRLAVGYLAGCLDTANFNSVMRDQIFPRTRRGFFLSGFAFDPRNLRRLFKLWRCARRGELTEPDLSSYPSHLHINLLESHRGRGAGAELIARFVDHCRAHGSPGIHLGSISKRAIPFFARNAFVELSRRRFTLYDDILEPTTDLVFMGMRL